MHTKKVKSLVLICALANCAFAETKEYNSIKDTIASTSTYKLKNKEPLFSITNERLVKIIDSLFESEKISPATINALNKFISTPKNNKDQVSESIPSCSYYSSWDNKVFFPIADKPVKDTALELILTNSVHPAYYHPCPGIINSQFGWRKNEFHNGIDINLRKGEPVYAAFDGKIRIATHNAGFGNVVVIRHYNGLETVYAHLSKIKVKIGQEIKSGDIIGLGGSTGKSTGPHLHLEVRFKELPINPACLISFTEQKLLYDTLVIKQSKKCLTAYPKNSKFHSVERGETLYTIAQRYGLSTVNIRRLNSIYGKACLKIGQKIRIS